MRSTNVNNIALHGDHFHPQQVIRCDAIFQTMRAARIHRNITGNRAGQLAGRVRGIKETLRLNRAGHAEVGAPRLNLDNAVFIIGFKHVIHPRHAQNKTVCGWQGPAGQ